MWFFKDLFRQVKWSNRLNLLAIMTLHYKFLKVWTHSAMIYVQKYRGLQLVMPCTVCKSWWSAFIWTKPGKLPPRLSLDSSSLEGDISSKVPPALASISGYMHFLLQPWPNELIHPKQSPTSRQSPRLPSNLPLLALLCQRQVRFLRQPNPADINTQYKPSVTHGW